MNIFFCNKATHTVAFIKHQRFGSIPTYNKGDHRLLYFIN